MMENRLPIRGGIWVDAYNMVTGEIAGTIKARIDANNLYFVTELYECDTEPQRGQAVGAVHQGELLEDERGELSAR